MYLHEGCRGELKKRHPHSTWYRCAKCQEKVPVGGITPRGVNSVKARIKGVIRTYYEIHKDGDVDMSLHTLISGGGKVLLVGGMMNPNWAKFCKHPQLTCWNGDQKDIRQHFKREDNFPDNTRIVILSKFISHTESTKVIEEARKKRAVIVGPLNDGEITRKLEEIFTPLMSTTIPVPPPDPTPVPVAPTPSPVSATPPSKTIAKRGVLDKLLAEIYDSSKTNIDEARRIFEIAKERGIPTTVESLGQKIYLYKKQHGIVSPRADGKTYVTPTDVIHPLDVAIKELSGEMAKISKKEPPTVEQNDLIKVIDDAITKQKSAILALELVREQIIEFKTNESDYKRLKLKLAQLANEF